MTAGGAVAIFVEEHDPEVSPGVIRWSDKTAIHVGVTPGLVDNQAPDFISMVSGIAPSVKNGHPREVGSSRSHDAERLARGVIIDNPDGVSGNRLKHLSDGQSE
jgi:hypothetical protein